MDKIENLNLVALRSYACAKVNGQKDWYLKCLECPELADCKVGQRAHDILENETTPAKTATSERFLEAAKHPDPAKWLYENGYYDKQWRANDAWKQHLVRTNGDVPKYAGEKYNTGPLLRERAINRIKSLMSDNPDEKELFARILKEKPELTSSSVNSRLYQWAREYPDIIEKYPQVNSLCRMINRFAKNKKPAKEAYDALFGADAEPEEDEVSIEDFLNETTTEPEQPEPIKDEQEPDPEQSSGDISPSPEQLVLQKEFTRKRVDLKFGLAHIQQAFEALDKERADILSKLEALDKTAELFGMRPIKKEESLDE